MLDMRIVRAALVAVVALMTIAACTSDAKPAAVPASSSSGAPATLPASSAAPACTKPHASGQVTETFDFQGESRTYELYVPASYAGTRAVPAVFEFHGYGSNAKEQIVYGNFMPLADRDGFVIVAPDGQVGRGPGGPNGTGGRHFNLSGEPGLQNDIQMIGALVDHIEDELCVDPARVFATGMSDGGATTDVLGCVASSRFAAFGAVSLALYVPAVCDNARSVPIMEFHGTADPVVPFDGGKVNCCGGVTLASAPDAMARWAAHDGCAPDPTDDTLGTEVVRRTWHGCKDGGDVVFFMVQGGGHTWPGSAVKVDRLGLTTDQVDASSTIWDFFASHPLP